MAYRHNYLRGFRFRLALRDFPLNFEAINALTRRRSNPG
jgi:hypothetical protein